MKILIITFARMHRQYIEDWLNYHQKLGVDKFVVYETNHPKYYYNDYLVKKIRTANLGSCVEQFDTSLSNPEGSISKMFYSYSLMCQEATMNHMHDYDWVCVLPIDEYIQIPGFNNLHDFLSQDIFSDCDMVRMNQIIYGDSGIANYDIRGVRSRFSEPAPIERLGTEAFKVRCFARVSSFTKFSWIYGDTGGVSTNDVFRIPLNILDTSEVKAKVVTGEVDDPYNVYSDIVNYADIPNLPHINHYKYKTVQEWIVRAQRHILDYPSSYEVICEKFDEILSEFFDVNEYTEEKAAAAKRALHAMKGRSHYYGINDTNIGLNDDMMMDIYMANNFANNKDDFYFDGPCLGGGKCVVVIPVYKKNLGLNETAALSNNLSVLKDRDVCVVCPETLKLDEYTILNECANIHILRGPDFYFKSVETYSALCKMSKFYENFSDYEYMLICQDDAWVFEDRLDYFINMKYDYYGAPFSYLPWVFPDEANRVGNGGLSLRRVQKFIDITKSIYDIQPYLTEDIFFCNVHKDWFMLNTCPLSIAEEFSWDSDTLPPDRETRKLPMGCHQYMGYSLFWKRHINIYE